MDSKWLLTSSGGPVLQPGEVECLTLSSAELESETNPTLRSGLLILTTHRLFWIPNSATSTLYASGIPLNSVSRIFSINMPIKSIANPKIRFQVFTSPEGKVGEERSNSAVMVLTFVLTVTGKSDPDAFLVKFWEVWAARAWENLPQEGSSVSNSNSDEEIEKTINIVDSGVGDSKEAPGGGSHDIPEEEEEDLCAKCNMGGRLLVCSEVYCPLAFHEECMPQTLPINSMDTFYCSYCSYRRAFLRTNKAKKALLLARKNLSLFLGESSANTHMQKASEGASIVLGETTCDETAKHLNEDGFIVHSGQLENDQEVERDTQVDENQKVVERFYAKPDDVGHQIERDIEVDDEQQEEEAEEPNIPTQLERPTDSSRKRKCDDKRTEMHEHDLEAGVEKRSVEHKDETPTTSLNTSSRTVEHEEEVEDSLESSINVEHKEKTTSNESKPHQSPQKKL